MSLLKRMDQTVPIEVFTLHIELSTLFMIIRMVVGHGWGHGRAREARVAIP